MKRSLTLVFILILAFSFAACGNGEASTNSSDSVVTDSSEEALEESSQELSQDVSQEFSNDVSQGVSQEVSKDVSQGVSQEVSKDVSQDTSSKDETTIKIPKDEDTYLMTIEFKGKKRDICLNKKMRDYTTLYNLEHVECDFAVLTDVNKKVKPTLVKKGDTFMNWKVSEVSAYFICLDDGRMYPTSVMSIKLEGDVTVKVPLDYKYYDGYDVKLLMIDLPSEDFALFPYPVYTLSSYSLDNVDSMKKLMEVRNVNEIVDKYNLKYGEYEGEVKIKAFNILYYQPGGGHYYTCVIDSIALSKEKLKTDSTKGEAYNTAIKAFNDFLNGKITAVADNKSISINNIGNSAGDPSIIRYALYDVNGDGIPELHARSLYYYIFTYQNNKVILSHKDTLNFWEPEKHPPENGGNIMDGSAAVLENGAVFSYTVSDKGRRYSYTTFDANCKATTLIFTDPTEYNGQDIPAGAVYTFDNKTVTQVEYREKTKEIFGLKEIYLDWKNYVPG